MAHGLGFYSGKLEGTKVLRELSQGDRALDLKQAQLSLEGQEAQSQSLLRQAQSREILSKMAREEQTAALLQQAMGGSAGSAMDVDGDHNLADQSISAGKAILGVDPKTGLELIKTGMNYQKDAVTKELQQIQIQKHKVEMQADIFAGITSQEELDQAIPNLARLGVQIPERYKQWSPESQNWIKNRAIASDKFLKKLQIDETERYHKIQEDEMKSKQEYRQKQLQLADKREERAKEKQDKTTGKLDSLNKNEVSMEVATLLSLNDDFDSLEPGQQIQAARDVYAIAADLKQENPDWNDAEAMQAAREQVFANIQEGVYLGASIRQNGANAKPTWDVWYAAAKEKNPGYSEADLRAFFDTNYGQ